MNILPILHLRRLRFSPGGIRHSRARRQGEADNLLCPGNSLSLKTAVFKDNHLLKLYLVLENGCFQGQSTKESVDFLDFKRVRMVAFECLRVQGRRFQARHSYAGRANQ